METKKILSKLKETMPSCVLDLDSLGSLPAVWVKTDSIEEIAAILAREFEIDWLENLSAVEIAGALVLTYFLRSTQSDSFVVLRCNLDLVPVSEPIFVPSVCSVWPMSAPFEQELTELFGIFFFSGARPQGVSNHGPFPLRPVNAESAHAD